MKINYKRSRWVKSSGTKVYSTAERIHGCKSSIGENNFFFLFWIKDTVDKKVTEAIDICRIIYEVNTLFF